MNRFSIKTKHIKILLISIYCLLVFQSQAQTKFTDNLKLMGNYHAGFAIPEYKFLTYIVDDYIRSMDVCLVKETTGNNIWEQLYTYPEYGISLFYSTLGNDKILGKEIALSYFFKINLISWKRVRVYNRTGIGFSYVTRKFDSEDNYLNVSVGTHLNGYFNFRIGVNYSLSEKIEFNSGLSFDHLSNTNVIEPNLGLNSFTAYGGLSYRLSQKTEKQKDEIPTHIRKNNMEVFFSIGSKHDGAFTTRYFFTSSVSLEMNRELFYAFYVGAGADLFYDSSVESYLQSEEKEFRNAYSFQSGIHLSQTFVYNRWSVILQEGIYVLLTDHFGNNIMYNRLILKYMISNSISIRFAMKTHLHILDYPELGIGYKF